jgi:hypothetical protein
MVLVNPRGALGLDAERSNQAQPFDQLWKIARRSCISSLPIQPQGRFQPQQWKCATPFRWNVQDDTRSTGNDWSFK